MKLSNLETPRASGRFDDLTAELTELFAERNFGAIEDLLQCNREYADRLRDLIPALEALNVLAGRSEHPFALEPDPDGGLGRLGGYAILREAGRGGMGVVYEALAGTRRVALKILPPAAALDPERSARFRLEADTAASLNHPSILPILEVGCDRGIPYYVMPFVEGGTLADWSLRARARGGDPRIAAGFALQAARALDHAHRRGVIHRDIKPANLLIDCSERLWIADFGLARLKEDSVLTPSHQAPGTLRYLPPEQAAGRRADGEGRGDIYALGATLYELITPGPAFGGDDRAEVLRNILSSEPRPPRSINPKVDRDLETIVQKAMAKEPQWRYPTAGELADDLERYLLGKPIAAVRPSLPTRVSRLLARRKAIVVPALAVFLLTSTVGLGLLLLENARTRRALDELTKRRERERTALRLSFAGSDLIASRALRMLGASGSVAPQDAEFCRSALRDYEGIIACYKNDAEMSRLVAQALHRVGFLRMILGQGDAKASLSRAVAMFEAELASDRGDREALVNIAMALEDLAIVEGRAGQNQAAEAARDRALEVRRQLVARFPDDREFRLSLALTIAFRIGSWIDSGKAREAEAGREELAREDDRSLGLRADSADQRNTLAWLVAAPQGGSELAYRRALEWIEAAVAANPKERRYVNTLGLAHLRVADYSGAAAAIETAIPPADRDSYDCAILAIAAAHLGDKTRAEELVNRSRTLVENRGPIERDFRRLLEEAESLIK